MKILVSGATGFIGKNLVKRLIAEKHEVCILVRPSTKTEVAGLPVVRSYTFNGDVGALTSFMATEKFDGVMHLATLYLAEHKTDDISRLIDANIFLGTAILEAAVSSKTSWFINTGTFGQHYDNQRYLPLNLYAATKQAFEDVARHYVRATDLNYVTVEISNTFGPKDPRPNIFNKWLKSVVTGENLKISPSDQVLDTGYIDNVIDAYIQMISLLAKDGERRLKGKIFVISAKKRYTLKQMASIFERITGKKLNITWDVPRKKAVKTWTKGKKVPGWKPRVTLEDGIKRIYEQSK